MSVAARSGQRRVSFLITLRNLHAVQQTFVFNEYLTALRASEVYRSEVVPRAEEAYRLYLARYREMAAAYPQVLIAQRTLFQTSAEYLDNLEEAWRAALRLQGFLVGEGLDAPTRVGEDMEIGVRMTPGGER